MGALATHRGYAYGPARAAPWQISWNSESTGSVALGWGRQKTGWAAGDCREAERGEQARERGPTQGKGELKNWDGHSTTERAQDLGVENLN